MTKAALRWGRIKADPVLHARLNMQRRIRHAERLTYDSSYARRERARFRMYARERTRFSVRPCDQCSEPLELRFVGPRRSDAYGHWRHLSNRIFCDTCRCEREKARRSALHLRRYIPSGRMAVAA